jgi:hypothetical protein
MNTPELYSYVGSRLELDNTLAEKIRRIFLIVSMTVELSAVVITQADETKVEGIKLKFNNENSTVQLTLNDIDSLLFTMEHLDIDSIVLLMYSMYMKNGTTNIVAPPVNRPAPVVDIKPKTDDFPM